MGTDCGLLIKVKGEDKKFYKRNFDRAYCFEHIGVGPDFKIEHGGLKDGNPLIHGPRAVRTTDEIKLAHSQQWAHDRIAFLKDNRAVIEKQDDPFLRVDYHLRWVTEFLLTILELEKSDNIETLWLADDNGETYDEIVFADNEIIDYQR